MKVLFIAGLGRSGSTLLNVFLGKSPNVLALGEIVNSPEDLKKRLSTEACTCKENTEGCNFWHGFSKYLDENYNTDYYETLITYVEHMYPEKKIIIDASKNINSMNRWLSLRKNNPNIQIYIIHLVRDVRGWVFSQYKRRKKGLLLNRLMWLCRNLYSWYRQNKNIDLFLNKYQYEYLRIGYEEFIFYRKKVVDLIFAYCNEANSISQYSSLSNSQAHELSLFSRSIKESDRVAYDFYWMNNWPCSFLTFVNPAVFMMNKKYVYGNLGKIDRISDIHKN